MKILFPIYNLFSILLLQDVLLLQAHLLLDLHSVSNMLKTRIFEPERHVFF